jgi:hypothetical protein
MLLDFLEEKRRRERAEYLERRASAGEIAFRLAEESPEFAKMMREAVEGSCLGFRDYD